MPALLVYETSQLLVQFELKIAVLVYFYRPERVSHVFAFFCSHSTSGLFFSGQEEACDAPDVAASAPPAAHVSHDPDARSGPFWQHEEKL